jgi:hypothetical protein
MRFDLARQVGQQFFESRLRVDAWINDHLAPQHHARGFFQESEREAGMECEVVLAVFAAPRKADLHGLFQRGAAGDHREIHRRLQTGGASCSTPTTWMENDGIQNFTLRT